MTVLPFYFSKQYGCNEVLSTAHCSKHKYSQLDTLETICGSFGEISRFLQHWLWTETQANRQTAIP